MRLRSLIPVVLVALGAAIGYLAASGRLAKAFAQDIKPKPVAEGSQLPKPDPVFEGKIGQTYKDSTPSFPQPLKAAKGSPNVLLIMLDDVGFGMCSTFGGPVPTPHMDKLADNGLKYNRFHTTALCRFFRMWLQFGHGCEPWKTTTSATFCGHWSRASIRPRL